MNDLLNMFLVILVSIGGGFVQRVSGFGLGIFVMLFFPYLMPGYTTSAAVSCMMSTVGSGYNALRYRKHIQIKVAMPLLYAAAVTIPVAVYFSSFAPEVLMKRLLGSVLILLSIYFLFFSKRVSIRPTFGNGILAGALGGTLNGLFSTGGPPVVLYLVHAATDNLVYLATIQFYFAVTNTYSTVMRLLNGMITWETIGYLAVSLVGWKLGDSLGTKVFNRLNGDMLKRIIYIGMIISGILMLTG